MPFGYSKEIFKYPPVQYIPLDIYNERIGNYSIHKNRPRIYVYNYLENNELANKLMTLGIHENYQIIKGQLAILVSNSKVLLNQYRGYEIIMVGNQTPGKYQLYTITDKYFYKDRLAFIFYDGSTNEKLDLVRYKPI